MHENLDIRIPPTANHIRIGMQYEVCDIRYGIRNNNNNKSNNNNSSNNNNNHIDTPSLHCRNRSRDDGDESRQGEQRTPPQRSTTTTTADNNLAVF